MKTAPLISPSCPHLAFEVLADLRLLVSSQSEENPTDAEWDAWLLAADTLGELPGRFRLLVLTEGGRPTREQLGRLSARKRAAEEKLGKKQSEPLAALVTSSTATRFIVSALTFVNPAIRCFAPTSLAEAYTHLGLTDPERKSAAAAIERLRAIVVSEPSAKS